MRKLHILHCGISTSIGARGLDDHGDGTAIIGMAGMNNSMLDNATAAVGLV